VVTEPRVSLALEDGVAPVVAEGSPHTSRRFSSRHHYGVRRKVRRVGCHRGSGTRRRSLEVRVTR
jgi:hypothetical protein